MSFRTVRCLSKTEKELIALGYDHGASIKELARDWEVSIRTIGRVLDELDVPTRRELAQGKQYRVVELLKKYNVTEEALEDLLAGNRVHLSQEVVQRFLNQATKETLSTLFYTSGLVKLAEIARANKAPLATQNQGELFIDER